MNRTEAALIDSPPRRWLQRYEARVMRRLGGRIPGGRVLELGCGSGFGTELILDTFGAARVDAVDLDPAMIDKARRRLFRHEPAVRLAVGSADDVGPALAPVGGGQDAQYNAVVDFAIIHHVPAWRDVLVEVARVLAPGGRFFFDEVTATALSRPSYRRFLDHPRDDRFSAGELLAELPRHGLQVGDRWTTRVGGDYVIGVAVRT